MYPSIPERLAIVETKVGEIQAAQGEIGEKVNAIYEHMVVGKANRRLVNGFLGFCAGLAAFVGTMFEIFKK